MGRLSRLMELFFPVIFICIAAWQTIAGSYIGLLCTIACLLALIYGRLANND